MNVNYMCIWFLYNYIFLNAMVDICMILLSYSSMLVVTIHQSLFSLNIRLSDLSTGSLFLSDRCRF